MREAWATDFHLGAPMQRVVRAFQEFDAWRVLPVFLLAGFCLTSLDATAKYLVQDHALFLVVWARYMGQMLIVAPFAWQRGGRGFWRTRNLALQLLRSTMLLGATVCFFAGLRYLPLAEGSAILFLAPIFIVILSGPILGERPTRARWVAAIAGFVGVAHPAAARVGDLPSGHAAVVRRGALQRALPRSDAQARRRRCLHDAVLQCARRHGRLHARAALGIRRASLALHDAGLFLLLGLLAGLGHWFVIATYILAPASLMTPFTYVQMIWAVFSDISSSVSFPDIWSGLGIAVIVLSGAYLAVKERRRAVVT